MSAMIQPGIFLDPAAAALIVRMTSAPLVARSARINALVRALKVAGVWAKLECLWVLAAHDAQAARLNWKSASFTLSAVNSPTFTTDRGYAGDGSTSYLATGWTASASSIFLQDSGALGCWLNAGTDTAADARVTMGNGNTLLAPRSAAGNLRGRVNQASSSEESAVATVLGSSILSRTASNLVSAYRNGSANGSWATVSAARATDELFLCARGVVGGPGSHVDNRISVAFVASGLTLGEVAALHAAVGAYLTAVGA